MRRVPVKYSVIIFLIPVIIFTGCGIKGNPVISIRDNRQVMQNMKAVSTGDAVVLKWDFYDKDAKINYIVIEKSEVGSAGNECKNCPRKFERIDKISVKGVNPESEKADAFSYTDKKVVRGKIYNYRLILCDDSDICLEGATTEINFK